MNLTELINKFPKAKPSQDHRFLEAGGIFVAIVGSSFDGHSVLDEAIIKKPAAIVVQNMSFVPPSYAGIVVCVPNTREAMDRLSHAYWETPSHDLFCVGITGTNGKTTTSHMIEFGLNHFGDRTGVIGTIDHHLKTPEKLHVWESTLTSPASFEFYQRLSEFLKAGATAVSVEVSSHALDQCRMTTCAFDVGVFTNLTRDHLDYHGSMDKYFFAKDLLFSEVLEGSPKKKRFAVVNYDDPYGRKLSISKDIETISYGKKNADLTYKVVSQTFEGQSLIINYKSKEYPANLKISGEFNILNYLATLGVMLARGIDIQKAIAAFKDFRGVKGRLERVLGTSPTSPNVFVDYAHTPDALENVLSTLNQIKKNNKIFTVFGCGGDRDKGKRPLMGAVACQYSDHVFITSDNPRTEDPLKIIGDIEEGCLQFKNFETEPNRKVAIEKAIEAASPGDAVLIAGKGHENYQIIGTTRYDFDDLKVASAAFSKKT